MGFLSSMLPVIEGAAVMAGGAAMGVPVDPGTAAAIVGAGNYAATGSIRKGLSAGMGAYGGAGLTGGLSSLGTSAATDAASAEAATAGDAAAKQAAEDYAKRQAALSGDANMWDSVGAQPRPGSMSLEEMQQSARESASNLAGTSASPFSPQTQAGLNNPYGAGIDRLTQPGGISALNNAMTASGGPSLTRAGISIAAPVALDAISKPNTAPTTPASDANMGQRYSYSPNATSPTPAPDVPSYESGMTRNFGRQQRYFNPTYTPINSDQAKQLYGYANGGVPTSTPVPSSVSNSPVEQMSNQNAIGANTGFPMADINHAAYATPWQTPTSENVVSDASDTGVNSVTGEQTRFATGGIADAHYNLGGYSDGGRLLKGPGDGVSDSIPAVIGHKQPARLADGEFVVPARIVSELGNGSTEAGARKLYAMMDRVQKARGKTTGKNRVATNTKADKYLPA